MGAVKGETLKMNATATAALIRKRFVSPTGGVPAANGNAIGVTDMNAAIGEGVVLDHLGTTIVETGAALPTLGAFLATDAQGRAIPWVANAVRVAILTPLANNTASAAGQFVSATLISNAMPTA